MARGERDVDPDPEERGARLGGGAPGGVSGRAGGGTAGSRPDGRWSRGSRVHCPREGAMFPPPRHSQMAAGGAEPQQKARGLEGQAEAGREKLRPG